MSPVLGNPAKRGKFAISNLREVLAKNAHGSDIKNLTAASRCAQKKEPLDCENRLVGISQIPSPNGKRRRRKVIHGFWMC
jgi:hypothetical protein